MDTTAMRREVEVFDDGTQTARHYDVDDRILRIETLDADDNVVISIDYRYDAAGNNIERVVGNGQGVVLRRIVLDEQGEEVEEGDADQAGPVRWKMMDGQAEGIDEKGQEKVGD